MIFQKHKNLSTTHISRNLESGTSGCVNIQQTPFENGYENAARGKVFQHNRKEENGNEKEDVSHLNAKILRFVTYDKDDDAEMIVTLSTTLPNKQKGKKSKNTRSEASCIVGGGSLFFFAPNTRFISKIPTSH